MASKSETSTTSGGVGLLGLLGLLFVGLKLAHVISWSWWWVLAPFWGGFLLFIVILAIGLAVIAMTSR